MDPKKLEIIKEILEHLSSHQAMGLKNLLDKSKAPKEMPGEVTEGGDDPKLMGVEVDVIKPKDKPFGDDDKGEVSEDLMKPGMEEMGKDGEMTDEELEELLAKLAS
jgi:hypothetical protein